MRVLPALYHFGKATFVHDGYAVVELIGRMKKPASVVSKYRQAEHAVSAAEKLGPNYAAFRMVLDTKSGTEEPQERMERADLPVSISHSIKNI
jgi:hypothetical protein